VADAGFGVHVVHAADPDYVVLDLLASGPSDVTFGRRCNITPANVLIAP
jgi:hypothetical protein